VPVRGDTESVLIVVGPCGECGYRTEGAVTGIGIEGMDGRLVLVIASVFIVPGLGCGAEIGRPLKPRFLEGLLDRVFSVSVICIFAVCSILLTFLLFMQPCDANFAEYFPEAAETVRKAIMFQSF